MRPLTISGATSVLGLQQEIQRSEESRYDHRLHGVLLVAQGMTCPEVARLLGDDPRSVENWVHRFDQEGLAGLTERERSGRPGRLDEKQIQEMPTDNFVQGHNKTFEPPKIGLGIPASQEIGGRGQVQYHQPAHAGPCRIHRPGLGDSAGQRTEQRFRRYELSRTRQLRAVLFGASAGESCRHIEQRADRGGRSGREQSGIGAHRLGRAEGPPRVPADAFDAAAGGGFGQLLERGGNPEEPDAERHCDNTANAFRYTEGGGTIESIVWPFLTDPDPRFLAVPPAGWKPELSIWLRHNARKSDGSTNNPSGIEEVLCS